MDELDMKIREVLARWDPIGVIDIAPDEYDMYIPPLAVMLRRHAAYQEVFDFLFWVASVRMMLHPNAAETQEAALSLVALQG